MKKLSLDQASIKTGYAIWEDGELISSGVFKAKDKDFNKRLVEIKDFVTIIITTEKIKLIEIEGIQLESIENQSKDISVETFRKLAMLQGVLITSCIELGVIYKVISPSVWKSSLGIFTAKRKEQKKAAVDLVKRTFDKDCSEDEADAICIGYSTIEKSETAW